MNRKELKCPVVNEYYGECEWERHPNKYYYKSEADNVMDLMEARIKELEAENDTLKADIEVLNDDCRIAKENEVKYHKAYLNELDENARLKAQVSPNEAKLKRALWLARAERAHCEMISLKYDIHNANWQKWQCVERKCRAYAGKFKEEQ